MKLGELESLDQMACAKYLKSLSFISSVGMLGFNFGGYLSSRSALINNDHLLQFAISVGSFFKQKKNYSSFFHQ
jgi:alpha/beta superfamily hydrolase